MSTEPDPETPSTAQRKPKPGPPERAETNFVRSLRSRADEISQRLVAERARVSTKNVNYIYNNLYATAPPPTKADPKRLHEYAEVIARLAVYLGMDTMDALRDYGIPLTQGVQEAVERSRAQSVVPRLVSDPILNQILRRKRESGENSTLGPMDAQQGPEVRIGLAVYPPFHWMNDSNTFLHRFTSSCLGAVNPDFIPKLSDMASMEECQKAVLSRNSEIDAVVGLYDTPNRRFLEMNFIHIPGILVPLGAIATSESIDWATLLDADTGRRPEIIAMTGEAGHILIMGACGYYPGRDLHLISEGSSTFVGQKLSEEFAKVETHSKPKVFVCGLEFCKEVYHSMNPSIRGFQLREDDKNAPAYRVGIALRGDAGAWANLIQHAISNELLGNALPHTAGIYSALFSGGRCSSLKWTWEGFPPESKDRFQSLVKRYLRRMRADLIDVALIDSSIEKLLPTGFLDKNKDDSATTQSESKEQS